MEETGGTRKAKGRDKEKSRKMSSDLHLVATSKLVIWSCCNKQNWWVGHFPKKRSEWRRVAVKQWERMNTNKKKKRLWVRAWSVVRHRPLVVGVVVSPLLACCCCCLQSLARPGATWSRSVLTNDRPIADGKGEIPGAKAPSPFRRLFGGCEVIAEL